MLPTVVVVVSVIAAAAVFVEGGGLRLLNTPTGETQKLPAGCVKPVDGYLFVTTNQGWNNTISHGPPWPVVTTTQGENVTIAVCNVDNQAPGFQIKYYYDSNIESLAPGGVLRVSFIADKSGTFVIYCSIFCAIHPEMIASLKVLPV